VVTHPSCVILVLPCSASESALVPSAPMLLLSKLCAGVSDGKDALKVVTHLSCVILVLPCSHWPSALPPSAPMLLSLKLCTGVR
jgi:hypothetical protein